MKFGLGLMGCFWLTSTFAASLPPNCNPVMLDAENPTLKAVKTQIFVLHNIGVQTLWITHPTKNPGASAGYTSELGAGKWSALVLKNPEFAIGCVESRPGHEQAVSCAEAISVCSYTTIPKDLQGNYWLVENQSMPKLQEALQKRLPVAKK